MIVPTATEVITIPIAAIWVDIEGTAKLSSTLHLASDRHDNDIRLGDDIRATGDNGCWALLESGLVRKWKPDEDHVPRTHTAS
jgi:hypothetical protein